MVLGAGLWETLQDIMAAFYEWGSLYSFKWSDVVDSFRERLIPDWGSQHILTIVFVMVFFWPVVVTPLMALTAASTWLFWLLTSLVLGIIQLIYVTYQFIMISGDVMGLSLLKTFAVIRVHILHYTSVGSRRSKRTSRRMEWKRRLGEAGNYENFLKIPIEPKPVGKRKPINSPTKQRKSSWWTSKSQQVPEECQSPIKRSMSVGNFSMPSLTETLSPITRNKSFDGKQVIEDEEDENAALVEEELGMTGAMLATTTARLREARLQASKDDTDRSSIKYLLSGVVKRNHLTVDDVLADDARAVADSGQHALSRESRSAIYKFYQEVEKCLDWVADSPLEAEIESPVSPIPAEGSPPSMDSDDLLMDTVQKQVSEISERLTLVRKMKQNVGRTALMLSGGGALAMYHLGTIRALIEADIYQHITVISGTSGGSISAAMCAIKTPEELLRDVCVRHVSTDYLLNGEMKKHNIRWFPTNMEMGAYWLKNRLLVDSADFKKCCDFYYGDYTFAEAFARTGKHVCITVSASRGQGVQRLLLNHISTPHVTVSSAVAASCALPGVMSPAKLMAKDSNGRQEPFEVDGVEWIDGSVQADLPFQRISTLFNVSNYIVSQTNFHVIPLMNKAHHPTKKSFYWRLFQTWEWDIRNRVLKLSRLGLFPKFFGQDMSKLFKQKYTGNLTIVPKLTRLQTIGLKALANPTVEDMEIYLKYGQIATWPYLNVIRTMMRLELALDDCVKRLDDRCRTLNPELDVSLYDDVESIVSGSLHASSISNRVRLVGSGREAERLKHKVMTLERENVRLRHQVEEMQRLLVRIDNESGDSTPRRTPEKQKEQVVGEERRVSEKEVWSLRRLRQEAIA